MMETEKANLTQAEFEKLSDLVYRHCGINLHDGKIELVRARLAKQMRVGGFETASGYIEHVLSDASGEEFKKLMSEPVVPMDDLLRELEIINAEEMQKFEKKQ